MQPGHPQQIMARTEMKSLAIFAVIVALSSCETVHFYTQALNGQIEILRARRPNNEVTADPKTPPELRRKLAIVEKIRAFASSDLHLPGDESYGKYADLGREHVVWVLYAAPEFSMKPKTWFYPAIGELNYRGYFKEDDARAEAKRLKGQGYDVCTGGVDAYSSLGVFHDPILNTFVDYPDVDLAETIFHELTHRKVFHPGKTVYNESLANVVSEEGVKRWLRHEHRGADLKKYEQRLVRRRDFYREIDRSRGELAALYASGKSPAEMRAEKVHILKRLRNQFLELRQRWGGHGLEEWLKENINNGHLVSVDLYYLKMPMFEKLLKDCNGDLDLFYKRADKLKVEDAAKDH